MLITLLILNQKRFSANLDVSLANFYSCSPVAIHFADKNHNLSNDFSFFIFNKDLNEDIVRKSIESDLINLFLLLGEKLINKFIPSKRTISSFSFT